MEFLGKVGVDLKILAAQFVNFIVLAVVLRYVLYKPIIRIFEAREQKVKKIGDGLADLDKKQKEADEEVRLKLVHADESARQILERSKNAATLFKNERLQVTEKEIDRMIEESGLRIRAEQADMKKKLEKEIAAGSVRVLEGILNELGASEKVHTELIGIFVKQVSDILSKTGLHDAGVKVEFVSAFPVKQKERPHFESIFKKHLPSARELVFASDPSLIAGAVLRIDNGLVYDFSLRGKYENKMMNA